MDDTGRILNELGELLRRYHLDERARFVQGLADSEESRDFWETLSGLEFWGGAGAIWEVEPFNLSQPETSGAAEDYRRFQTLMVRLSDILESRGLSSLATPTVSLFRRQIEEQA